VVVSREIWSYAESVARFVDDIDNYSVEASDGAIGSVRATSIEAGRSYVVAAGGSWNGGKTVMLPAGIVGRVDHGREVVHLICTREQIQNAPLFEGDRYQDAAYRVELGGYYASLSASHTPRPASGAGF
jgi:hypothetical protein